MVVILLAKEKTIVDGNGHDRPKEAVEEMQTPLILATTKGAEELVKSIRQDSKAVEKNVDLSKYYVMEGMQNTEKVPFFTEFINDDDVLRMNTIEAFVTVAPLVIRKTSDTNRAKIDKLLYDVYRGHVNTHKTNMVSKLRKREDAYVRILSSDSSDSGIVPTGIKKFFGIGGKK